MDQFFASIGTLVASVVIGSTSGTEELAHFSLAFTMMILVTSLHLALVIWPVFSLVPGMSKNDSEVVLAGLFQKHRQGIVLLVVVGGLLLLVPGQALIGAVVLATAGKIAGEFQRRVAYIESKPFLAFLTSGLMNVPILLVAALAYFGLLQAVTALHIFATMIVGSVFAVCLCLPRWQRSRGAVEETWKRMWPLARWHLASVLVMWATNHGFSWYLAIESSLDQVAYLHVARTFLGLPLAALLALDAWFQPGARRGWVEQGLRGLSRSIAGYAGVAVAIVGPCAAILWWAPEFLVSRVFGSSMTPAVPSVMIAAILALLAIPDRMVGLALTARQAPMATFVGFVVCAIVVAAFLPSAVTRGAVGCMSLLQWQALLMAVVPAAVLVSRWRKWA